MREVLQFLDGYEDFASKILNPRPLVLWTRAVWFVGPGILPLVGWTRTVWFVGPVITTVGLVDLVIVFTRTS